MVEYENKKRQLVYVCVPADFLHLYLINFLFQVE